MEHLSPQSVRAILDERRRTAGVQPFTPHDLRRTVVVWLLDANVDPSTAMKVTGHKRIETLLRYDRRGQEAARRAIADHIQVPYYRGPEETERL